MNTARTSAACVVNGDYLYAIGGYAYSHPLVSIERMVISAMPVLNGWKDAKNPLITASLDVRAVSIKNFILVVLGQDGLVEIIDTLNGEVKAAQKLSRAVAASSVIKVDNVVYSFGDQKLETLYVIFLFL